MRQYFLFLLTYIYPYGYYKSRITYTPICILEKGCAYEIWQIYLGRTGEIIGIWHVKASCLPETKLAAVRQMEKSSLPVCMIGDGINDAPALKAARVGIAMGGVGSDIAVDAADIALVDDEVKELPHLFALSKHMMKTIRYNLTFSMGLNFTAIVLAMTGILNPVTGALVHNAGSVFVILNSALLLKWKMRYNDKEVNIVHGDEAVYEKVHG